ncbi:CU044_5270 family protein [Streptomyces sp. NPDC001743]|uniref:CU044_5270 family protein n=1 Tax=Streptomyces sp. NPDC001743 TaxID=3154397 RepID=UPI00332F5625
MMRTPWRRREPLGRVELAGLLPGPGDPELPRDRLTALEEHLMNEIQQHHARQQSEWEQTAGPFPPPPPAGERRSPRRLVLVGAAVAVAVLAGAVGVGRLGLGEGQGQEARGGGQAMVPAPVVRVVPGTTQGLGRTVDRISVAAGKERQAEPGPGQFIYIQSQVSWLSTESNLDSGKTRTWVQKLHPREVWMSPDGHRGWLIETGNGNTSKEGMTLDSDQDSYLSAPSYDYLKTLPTDPDALLKKIYAESAGQGNGKDQEAFTVIGDLVREQLMTPELTAALYRAAAKIPGVVLVDEAKDAVGRSGIAIARVDEHSGERTEWIFDGKSFSYLGERTVQIREAEGIEAGTVTARTAITERAVVDEMKAVPGTDKA